MNMKFRVVVEINLPWKASTSLVRTYVGQAISGWGGGGDPENVFFGIMAKDVKILECKNVKEGTPALADAVERLAQAERLLGIARARLAYHNQGKTHWNACELDHEDCLLLKQIDRHMTADSAPAVDPERVEIARCPRCGGLPRPTLMGRTICDRCGGLDVPQPPSPTVLRQIEALNADSASVSQGESK
jgi:hypothetical protein